ncbi:DUF402 domain-containing protein [Ornithinibacillus scapharcae]|uniref:DUF402 domain-containing protein n=1 Tax=Ornithinibacillus scapharcae TaxID=1147159 RepID=UPI000225B99F|nr:DUF402 domain-containing protein [Ornithinibacillus scapharcae]
MVKRRYGDRSNWPRIIERQYAQANLDEEQFKGNITLIEMVKVKKALMVTYGENEICIVHDGYRWLLQFPHGQHHAITTTFDKEGNIVQWYIDICVENGVEDGVPYTDDLYLDIVVLPTGEVFVLDEEELEEALATGTINQELYDLAWSETKRLLDGIYRKELELLSLAHIHRKRLEKELRAQV